jgi:hypothetical protein
MPRYRVGDVYYSEEEYKDYKFTQSAGAIIIVFLLFGGLLGYQIAGHYQFQKIYTFIATLGSALISGFIAVSLAKYLVLIFRVIVWLALAAVILWIIWLMM